MKLPDKARVRSEIAEGQRQRLAQEAPDLAVHVNQEKLSLDEAIAKLERRKQDQGKAQLDQREVA